MKTNLFIVVLIFLFNQLNAQFTLNLKGVESQTGRNVILTGINIRPHYLNYCQALFDNNGDTTFIVLKELKNYKFSVSNLTEFWQNQSVVNEVYLSFEKYGFQYDLRKEWEAEALQYLNELEQKDLIFDDSYLENYLYTIVYKLYPGTINDGRLGIVNVKIMIDSAPNAFIFPNGTLIVTTGLLSTINSEEELIGSMAHEIAHFVLDHTAININKASQRQKSALFWAAFATTIASAADIYTSSKNYYYVPGVLTYTTAILSYSIASSFTERLGLKYSQEQEFEADRCAVELMNFINVDPTSLSSTLSKIRDYFGISGNYLALTGEGTHPNIQNRINAIGKPNQFNSSTYDKLISSVFTTNAIIEYNNKHFDACKKLIERNINTGLPTEDDYILKVMTNLCLYDNSEKNSENITLIAKAKNLNIIPSINLYKQEALAYIRLNNYPEALISLQSYSEKLNDDYANIDKIKNENLWSSMVQYYENEIKWTKLMIYKVNSM